MAAPNQPVESLGPAASAVSTFIVRVWLPDRPGALGQVASRIGALRGDVAGIEILERGGGRAIDELVVDLPDPSLVDMLVREINEVDGVDVESVVPLQDGRVDPWLDALDMAARLVGADTLDELLGALCEHARRAVGATWSAVVSLEGGDVHSRQGPVPSGPWLAAFLDGSRHSARLVCAQVALDVTWAPLPAAGRALVLGRDVPAYRAKERHQIAALARIADTRYADLRAIGGLQARLAHPSRHQP